MPLFNYQARSINGRLSKGKLEAKDEADARIKLRSKQLIPVKITLHSQKEENEIEKAIK
ncbi:MAG: type II secretion system F family protein, partial [Bdellovibrionaceae bacterium]|nr:type II secretion system F family protein [Pseudobdellovibrionaceae bacterium]